ncbi:MAG: hypothetical protein IT201_07790 [Thermoleophilia bacterium]|nr:hypothetical protein [Thermoleophilia bacterium]
MGFLDKAKEVAGQAAVKGKELAGEAAQKAKEEAKELQLKRDLNNAYEDLGKTAFDLADQGQIASDGLAAGVERIRSLRAELDALNAS